MKAFDLDLQMMQRCVELAESAVSQGELPFSCVICRDGGIIAESTNRVVRDGDATRHAELLAISEAQRVLGRTDLSDCTLYSSVEPCPMCAFPIRETRVGRVVYAVSSPMMGGHSKWNVLGDTEISSAMPQVFGGVPEVKAGLCYSDVAAVWRKWNPVFWLGIRLYGYLGETNRARAVTLQERRPAGGLLRRWVTPVLRRLTG